MSSPDRRTFTTPRTATYLVFGSTGQTSETIFALHGYGQTVNQFSRDVRHAASSDRRVIIPEALSRFYVKHEKGIVGASWMTSREREYEILDYVTYLDALFAIEAGDEGSLHTVLGFSQGCPTAMRWLANGAASADRLILWGAGHAHDLSDEEWAVLADIPEIVLVGGAGDEIVPPARLDDAEKTLAERGCRAKRLEFDGGHEIPREVLTRVLQRPGHQFRKQDNQ